jgi:hypothetical protein
MTATATAMDPSARLERMALAACRLRAALQSCTPPVARVESVALALVDLDGTGLATVAAVLGAVRSGRADQRNRVAIRRALELLEPDIATRSEDR